MKIKTITCHNVYNHGASLQAYALQTYLSEIGHDVEIIDYNPSYLNYRGNIFAISPKWSGKNILLRFLYVLYKLPLRLRWFLTRNCRKEFDKFTAEFLKTTQLKYTNVEELRKSPPEADVYVVGSDQVWNTTYWSGRDPAFFLDFGAESTLRASYAASFGTGKVIESLVNVVKKRLSSFDSISVREREGIDILQRMGIHSGKHVMDPVFLLEVTEWNRLISEVEVPSEKYILIYDFEGTREFEVLAKSLAVDRGLKIYSINNYSKTPYADKDFHHSGPQTFLALVKNADLVLSNSFHATAFSLIFERDFLVVPRRKDAVNSRMESLLKDAGMLERLLDFSLNIDFIKQSEARMVAGSVGLGAQIRKSKEYIQELL